MDPTSAAVPAGEQQAVRQRGKTSKVQNGEVTSSTKQAGGKRKLSSKAQKRRRSVRRFLKKSWSIPLLILVAILSLYAVNPSDSNIVHHFIFPSYPQQGADADAPRLYGKGLWDVAFVSFYIVFLTFTREFIMQELLRPLARYYGIKKPGKQLRFMEQVYTAIYFGIMGPFGLYVMHRTPVWYFNTYGMYEGFPHKTTEAVFKFYYLFQAAYWAQQAIVMILGVEARRSDFKELVAHHIITLSLIGGSYRFHFTYMGIAVYITHDISDLFLAVSKSLHYIGSPIMGIQFGVTIGVWAYTRHYLNLRLLYSIQNEFKTVGPYELNWETEQYKCWIANIIAFTLLSTLQAINLFWLYCLLRSAFRFLVYNVAKDDRSEAEESEVEASVPDALKS